MPWSKTTPTVQTLKFSSINQLISDVPTLNKILNFDSKLKSKPSNAPRVKLLASKKLLLNLACKITPKITNFCFASLQMLWVAYLFRLKSLKNWKNISNFEENL